MVLVVLVQEQPLLVVDLGAGPLGAQAGLVLLAVRAQQGKGMLAVAACM
jgi:hypothetical protein